MNLALRFAVLRVFSGVHVQVFYASVLGVESPCSHTLACCLGGGDTPIRFQAENVRYTTILQILTLHWRGVRWRVVWRSGRED